MKDERYMSWFRNVVETGWTCGLYKPQEILANVLRNAEYTFPTDEEYPYEHINRFMRDTMQNELMMVQRPSLQEAIEYFNKFYEDGRFDFGAYTKEVELAEEE